MARPKGPPRVLGPYFDSPSGKYKIRIYDGKNQHDAYFPTFAAAELGKSAAALTLRASSGRCLEELIDEYLTEKQRQGVTKPEICIEQRAHLRRFFAEHLQADPTRFTPLSARELYDQVAAKPNQKTGVPLAAATHRFYLKLAQALFGWIVRKGYLGKNPFAGVAPVGRVSAGKTQLRIEEAKRYGETALRLYDEGQVLALAAVLPLYLGLRAGEVLNRQVRDVDCEGGVLWISAGKTRNARRRLVVKALPLRQRLFDLASGRPPEAPLFGLSSTGRPRQRQVFHKTVRRICQTAGVPVVCPHSLNRPGV
jgi:integrase